MTRILVTGSTGTVGGLLAKLLLASAQEGSFTLRLGGRNLRKLSEFGQHGAEIVEIDYDNPSTLRSALAGVERLFLVTGYTVEMLEHSKAVLDIAKQSGVYQVVHLGAPDEEDQQFPHLIWHSYVESYIERLGFCYAHIQPRTYMQNVLNALRPGSTIIKQFLGDQRAAWIDPLDIAKVAKSILLNPDKHAGQTYSLAVEALTMSEVAQILSDVTGIKFTYEPQDPALLPSILQRMHMEPTYAASLAKAVAAAAQGNIPSYAMTNDNIRLITGENGSTWRDFAYRNKDAIVTKANHK